MNAGIIYDDVTRASEAKAMFERAAHRADVALLWTVKPWRLDLLMLHLTADKADAHLMVLAQRHGPCYTPSNETFAEEHGGQAVLTSRFVDQYDHMNKRLKGLAPEPLQENQICQIYSK
jgi:hypothetical protein